jgi:uncharacterized membrane protein
LLSILYGILSAGTWGAADFIGGIASKRTSPYRVLFLAEIAGLVPFVILALVLREPFPSWGDMLLGAGSSLVGLGGLLLLYRALASGQMTIAAPVSALFAALLPVVFGFFTLGAPSLPTLFGFGLAFLAVWLISQTDAAGWRSPLKGLRSLADLRLPLLSGLFFGLYFLVVHRATLNAFFWPLVAARFAGFAAFGLFALFTRYRWERLLHPRRPRRAHRRRRGVGRPLSRFHRSISLDHPQGAHQLAPGGRCTAGIYCHCLVYIIRATRLGQ